MTTSVEKIVLAFKRTPAAQVDKEQRRMYTLVCDENATKAQIKQAVAETYGVQVQRVNTSVRRGHHKLGRRKLKGPNRVGMVLAPTRKIAYVTLSPGNEIAIAFTAQDLMGATDWEG